MNEENQGESGKIIEKTKSGGDYKNEVDECQSRLPSNNQPSGGSGTLIDRSAMLCLVEKIPLEGKIQEFSKNSKKSRLQVWRESQQTTSQKKSTAQVQAIADKRRREEMKKDPVLAEAEPERDRARKQKKKEALAALAREAQSQLI